MHVHCTFLSRVGLLGVDKGFRLVVLAARFPVLPECPLGPPIPLAIPQEVAAKEKQVLSDENPRQYDTSIKYTTANSNY